MCRVNVFCCGGSLRSGAITALVLTGLSLVSHFYYGANLLLNTEELANQAGKITPEERETFIKVIKIGGGVLVGIGALETIIFICLLLAIVQKKASLVMPWLIMSMIGIVLACLSTIVLLFFLSIFIIILLAVIAFQLYLWIVVLNYYWELKNGPRLVYSGQPAVYAQTTVYAQPLVYPNQPVPYPNQPAPYPNQPAPYPNQPMQYPSQPPDYEDKSNLYPTTEKV